jgi:anti-sigma factor RsiW
LARPLDCNEIQMMTDPTIPVTEDELHAYVDNELPAERRSDVERWLAAHPADGERVESWRSMAEALHARYDSVSNEPVPPRLELDRLDRNPRRWMLGAVAASIAAFAVGGVILLLTAPKAPARVTFGGSAWAHGGNAFVAGVL